MRHLNTRSITIVRQSLHDTMTRVGWKPDTIIDAQLALVELLVNAWQHGDTPVPLVQIISVDRSLRVSVTDESPLVPNPQTPGLFAESGRGLQLVEGLTHRWGVEPQTCGKSVWFELDGAA